MSKDIKISDYCTLKNDDYLTMQVLRILPKQGNKAVMVECLVSGGCYPPMFHAALVRLYRKVDLKVITKRMTIIDTDRNRVVINQEVVK